MPPQGRETTGSKGVDGNVAIPPSRKQSAGLKAAFPRQSMSEIGVLRETETA